MADPLSLITAVVTIVEATAKISKMCHKYYMSVRKSQNAVLQLRSEIQTLLTIAEQLEARLRAHDTAAALGGVDDSDGDDSDDSDYKDIEYSWSEGGEDKGDPSPPTLPVIRSLMNDGGVFVRYVSCLQDLEKRLEVTYEAWNSQKESQQGSEEANGSWHQKREKVRGLAMRLVWPLKESELNNSIDIIHRLCSIIQMAMGVEMVLKVDDIDRKADAVQSTVTDIQRQQAVLAAQENTRRAVEAAAQEKTRRLRQRLAACSWLDGSCKQEAKNESVYKRRAPNTSAWLLESEPFSKWKTSGDTRKMFWLKAIPGCGKTVLASTVIHHLGEQHQPATAALIYFYFDASDDQMTTSDRMLRSLLAQLVHYAMMEDDGPLPEPVMRLASKCLRKHRLSGLFTRDPKDDSLEDTDSATYEIKAHDYGVISPSADEVLTALQDTASGLVRNGRNIYVVIDALDECADLDVLIRVLNDGLLGHHGSKLKASFTNEAVGNGNLHLFCTSRHVPSIAQVFDLRTAFVVTADKEAGQNEDINGMVRQQLEQDKRLCRWPSMHDEIQEALTRRAQGMFRLATCQLDILRKCKTLRSLREALKTLPTTLSDTYKSTILAINEDDRAYAVRALLWLAVSTQPLTVREMVDILAVDMEDIDEDSATPNFIFDEEQRINDLADIPVLCTTLVQTATLPGATGMSISRSGADTDNLELRLAHHTVREYVLSESFLKEVVNGDESLPAFLRQITDQRTLHVHVATTLLSYLLCLQEPVRNHIGMTMCARKNVRNKYCCKAKWMLQVHETVFNPGCLLDNQLRNRPLAGYAARYWPIHFKLSWKADSQARTTDPDTNSALVTLAMRMLGPEDCSDEKGRANMTLSYINMIRIRKNWLIAGWSELDELYNDKIRIITKPLEFATLYRLDRLIPSVLRAWDMNSPHLRNAALLGNPELLRALVNVNDNFVSRLEEERICRDKALLDALLEYMTPESRARLMDIALSAACRSNDVHAARKWLEAGAKPTSLVLSHAVQSLAAECIELLLPMVPNKQRQNTLGILSLVGSGNEANSKEIKSVLGIFAKYVPLAVLPIASNFAFHDLISDILLRLLGAGDIVHLRQLLARGALDVTGPVSVEEGPETYPLFLAVLSRDVDLARLFLEYGAVVDATDANYTALTQAAYNRDLALVQLLVEEGHASLTYASGGRGSPVHAAILGAVRGQSTDERACDAVLEYLLAHGADANHVAHLVMPYGRSSNRGYLTPLCLVAELCTDSVSVKMATILLRHGADPNWMPDKSRPIGPLGIAIKWRKMELVKVLLAAGAYVNGGAAMASPSPTDELAVVSVVDNKLPLSTAIESGDARFVQVLLCAGADANAVTEMSSDTDISILGFCSFYDNAPATVTLMRMLLFAGADPHRHNRADGFYEPLLHSISAKLSGETAKAKMRLLVDYGANVNAAADNDGDCKNEGWTALLRAASNPSPDLLAYLLDELGADPHVQLADGRYAVHVAAAHDYMDSLGVLAKHLDMNLCSHAGGTPLHAAAANGAVDSLEWLLKSGGADATIRDAAGMTARDCAMQSNANESQRTEMLALLDEAVRKHGH